MKRKPVYQPSMSVVLLSILMMFIYMLIASRLFGQSIGVSVGLSGNGVVHTGIQLQNITGKVGLYGNVITDETDGNRETFNTYDKNLRHLSGFTAGVSYQISNVRQVWLSAGFGRIKDSSYACGKCDDKVKVVAETFACVQLTRWLDCFFGVNSYPMVVSGLNFKICK